MIIPLHSPDGKSHKWFAWRPVLAYRGYGLAWVWLSTVERRWTDGGTYYACYEYWVIE